MPEQRVLLFEHVNLNISPSGLQEVRSLFIDALGLSEDPRPALRGRINTLLWANMGLCQFHFPVDTLSNTGTATQSEQHLMQRIPGHLTLSIPPLSLSHAITRLTNAGVPFVILSDSKIRVTAPCCDILLEEMTDDEAIAAKESMIGRVGQHEQPMSVSLIYTMKQISIRVVDACQLSQIATFWREIIGAIVLQNDTEVSIAAGPQGYPQKLLFFTTTTINSAATGECCLGNRDGGSDEWHLALYIRDWEGALERAKVNGVAFDNLRFSDRLEEATINQQFRTLEMGLGGPRLELEIRSVQHTSCPL